MAIVIDRTTIGSSVASSGSTTYTFTTTGAVASGGFIVLAGVFLDAPASIVSITDNDGGTAYTYTVDKNVTSGGVRAFIASAQATTGLPAGTIITLTVSTSASAFCVFGGMSFTGVKTTSPVDGTPLGPVTAAAAQPWSTGNYTVAAGSVIIGACFNSANDSANTATAPSVESFDLGNPVDHDFAFCAEYRIESSAGAVPVAGSWGTANNSFNLAVAYLTAAAPGPTPDTETRRYQTRRSRMTSW